MRTFLIDNDSHYQKELAHLLADHHPEIIPLGSLKVADIPAGSFVVLSGGHTLPVLWHDQDFAKEIDIIKHHTGPILGVCLGAQLIAHVYESHLHYLEKRRKGLVDIQAAPGTDFLEAGRSYRVYESHHWSIARLGKTLEALALSDDGVEIFRHRHRPMFGLQFHPESAEPSDGRQVYARVLSRLGVPRP